MNVVICSIVAIVVQQMVVVVGVVGVTVATLVKRA